MGLKESEAGHGESQFSEREEEGGLSAVRGLNVSLISGDESLQHLR